MAKVALLLLIFFAVIALIGKWRIRLPRLGRRSTPRITATRCRACGRLKPSSGRCDCGAA